MKRNRLDIAECQFCGADNSGKYEHIHLYTTEDDEYFVKCNNCSAQTPTMPSVIGAMAYWRAKDYTIPSHDEAEIYQGCVDLLQGMVESFGEWLEFTGLNEHVDDDMKFSISMQPTEIVNRLFLSHTSHSGGTSTRAKCRELGIEDSGRSIKFAVEDENEE